MISLAKSGRMQDDNEMTSSRGASVEIDLCFDTGNLCFPTFCLLAASGQVRIVRVGSEKDRFHRSAA